ncbi:hypothetical protein B0H16DRAFT_1549092 [Mycena metata]|uniref:Uncharacterized protein n=1 Tax=Mycena metata TaxID=1033252 RepID=A0AAD7N9W2_9AGAR|nr:hypothetical protein B0H16DRAFT_1549092 [Mycena metata]
MADRSTSRGRDAVTSSGRGGMGNMAPTSPSRDRPVGGPDDFSSTRGREPPVAISEVRSTGRGGAGNFRSPSRDPKENQDVRGAGEREIIRAHDERDKAAVHSTGRGGAGNISRSRSRGPTHAAAEVHSSGRGGAGNIATGPPPPYERGRSGPADGVHSTGRGGLANLTSLPAPPPDQLLHHHPGEYESSGRGGAGNMTSSRERTGSKERSGSKDRAGGGGIGALWNRLHGPGRTPPVTTIREDGKPAPAGVDGGVAVGVGGGGQGAI